MFVALMNNREDIKIGSFLFLYAISIVVLMGCADQRQSEDQVCSIYNIIIQSLYKDKIIAILKSTTPAYVDADAEEKYIKENMGDLIEEETYKDYSKKNHNPHELLQVNCLNPSYIYLNDVERKLIFIQGRGWVQFQELFPESTKSLITFSRVGLNNDADQALVYVQNFGEVGSEQGLYVLLIKHGNSWEIVRSIAAWIS
jgi:hypothetical protein